MERHRTVAGSPVRTAAATWSALTALVVACLEPSPDIDTAEVSAEFASAAPAGTALIAGDYLTGERFTIIAGTMRLHIDVATGADAIDTEVDERLDAVPGAATATSWNVYIDAPGTLANTVSKVLAPLTHFHSGAAPAVSDTSSGRTSGITIDLDALARLVS